MMKMTTLLLGLFILTTCSNVNRESRTYYDNNKNPIRHGIVPISKESKPKKALKLEPINDEAVARGEFVYQQNCQSCHGVDGTGNGPMTNQLQARPANLVKLAKEVPYFKFYIMVSRWQGDMPGWKNVLSEKEVRDLEQYIRSMALAN